MHPEPLDRPSIVRPAGRALLTILAAAAVSLAWTTGGLWHAWRAIDRVEFDTASAREALDIPPKTSPTPAADPDGTPSPPPTDIPESPTTTSFPVSPEPSPLRTFLVIGSDSETGIGGRRADVIVVVLLPGDGTPPVMVSIPRDLYVANPCTDHLGRINATLNGCGPSATGPELLAIAVEDFTGLAIDHYVEFSFEGFRAIIDRVGGIEVCLDHPVRDPGYPQLFPAGCTIANGQQMLAWVRSRHTQELIDGSWRTVPGVNDLHRNRRQRELLIDMLLELKQLRSITDLTALAEDLAGAFTLDEGLSLGTAIGIAWDLRGLDVAAIIQPEIPVGDHTTPGSAMVLVPLATFAEVLESAGVGHLL
jgi:LCP family protein required for cell wall assembly